MSDPMTNMNGDEDVLASIRRLVVDSRAARDRMAQDRPSAANRPSNGTSSAPELLLLTTDFLVEKGDDTPSVVAGIPPLVLGPDLAVVKPAPTVVETSDVDAPSPVDAVETVDVEAAEQADTIAANGDLGAPAILVDADAAPHIETDTAAAWHAKLDDTPNGAAMEHAAQLNLEQRIAELESAIGSAEGDWEPDGSENLEGETPRQLPRGFADIVLSMRAEVADVAEPTNAPDHTDVQELVDGAETEFVSEGFEAAEANMDAEERSDVSDLDALDMDEAPEGETPTAETVFDDAPADDMQNDASEVDLLDEQTLRAIISDVLNEELRGHLGERMTRNIRRLVRREVQRALSVRDLQ